jgi:hypothetical protein
MLENLGDLKCIFCSTPIPISDLRNYLSTFKYRQLADKEVDHLFRQEIGLLDTTRIVLDEEQRLLEIDTMIKWFRKDGMSDGDIFQTLSDMGYMKEDKKKSKPGFIYMCPKCSDVLDQDNYTCSGCNIEMCEICTDQKESGHVCDERVLATLSRIQATCEPCPKCHIVIEKESGGCDQMFCTKCKTTFSWATRRIITNGEVHHNPHFYEWQRKEKGDTRNILDNPCEGHFLMKCDVAYPVDKAIYLKFVQGMLYKSVEAIIGIQEREDFIRHQFRALYLTKRFSFKRWKGRFKQHVNTLRRNYETQALLLTCLDSLYYITLSSISTNACAEMLEELFSFITYHVNKIQSLYGRTINYIVSTENIVLPYMN